MSYLTQIILKQGITNPGTVLEIAEPAYDSSNCLLYVGNGVGNSPTLIGPISSSGDVTKEYVDGSLSYRDSSLNDLLIYVENFATNSSVGLAFLTNASLGQVTLYDLTPYATNVSTNLALTQKLNKTTDTFTGVLTVDGSLYVIGNIYQDGSTYIVHAENLNTNADFITLRENAVLQIPDGSISGLKIIKADGTHDLILGASNDAILKVGWSGDILVKIAAREDAPLEAGYAYWNDASTIFKTKTLVEYVNEASLGNDFYWNADLLDVSTINIEDYFYSKGYIDGSLQTFSNLYATNVSVGNAFRTNSSLGFLSQRSVVYNSSIGRLDVSIKQIYPLVFKMNSSLGLYATNSSVNDAFITNVSLGQIYEKTYIDGSLNLKYNLPDVSTFSGTYTSDGSIVTVQNGLIISVI